MTAPDAEEPQHAFFRALIKQSWTVEQYVKALYGWGMRTHAEADHPDAVDKIAQLSTEQMDPALREAWLFGYRFRDTAAPGGDGVGNEGGDGG